MNQFFRARHQLHCAPCQDRAEQSRAVEFWRSRYRETGLHSPPDPITRLGEYHVLVVSHQIVRVGHRTHPQQLLSSRVCGTATLTIPNSGSATGRVTRLAIDSSPLMGRLFGKVGIFAELASCLHSVALSKQLTHLEAVVHPRHGRLYRRVFGAQPIGEVFRCGEVGAEAQRMRAQIEQPRAYHRRLRSHFLGGEASVVDSSLALTPHG
ncbi:MAG: hypothetical protein AAFU85_05780 [Planctomycetota bacterium]